MNTARYHYEPRKHLSRVLKLYSNLDLNGMGLPAYLTSSQS